MSDVKLLENMLEYMKIDDSNKIAINKVPCYQAFTQKVFAFWDESHTAEFFVQFDSALSVMFSRMKQQQLILLCVTTAVHDSNYGSSCAVRGFRMTNQFGAGIPTNLS